MTNVGTTVAGATAVERVWRRVTSFIKSATTPSTTFDVSRAFTVSGVCRPRRSMSLTINVESSARTAASQVLRASHWLWCSDGARCLQVGCTVYAKYETYILETFHERCTHEFGREYGSTGALPPQKNIEFGLDEVIKVQFPAALFGLFYCRSSIKFLPHLHFTSLSLFLCKFGGITIPIFSKNGEVRTPRLDPPVYLSSTFTN